MATEPKEVDAEVQDEGEELSGAEGQQQREEPTEVEAVLETPAPSRREQKRQVRAELAELRDQQKRDAEDLRRLITERLTPQQPQFIPQQQFEQRQAPQARNFDKEEFDAQRELETAFNGKDFSKVLESQRRLAAVAAERAAAAVEERLRASIPPPRQENAPYVRAAENQHPDVLSHPRGDDSVRYHLRALVHEGRNPYNYETMMEAFGRARRELGTSMGRREESTGPAADGTVSARVQADNRRAMMGNAPATSVSGKRAGGGGDGEVVGGLVPGWKDIAKAAGMSEQSYLKRFKQGTAKK